MLKRKKIYPVYVSKHNSKHEKAVILFMIPNGKGWYLWKLSALFREIASKNNGIKK